MESFKERCCGVTFGFSEDKTGSRVLEFLKFVNEIERRARQKDVTVVEFGENECACKNVCDLNRQIFADGADSMDFKVG
jgi:hypothetical protein